MNFPNTITMLRLLLTAIFCVAASAEGTLGYTFAFVLGAISYHTTGQINY